ncbi:DUF2666 domain-containing protein [Methanococcus voltae]|uniref:Proteasome-type protease n=2 Tax=Methanococcus voltae TaxID=2188 RepID=A0ABT2F056_METVO|nr:DUF2666 domain-containing protein [Methanococcus voltae]MBP2173226.1 putative proteasome-type protease [Methanococcus voltae]MBP2202090.1 putative proteasome-type protease [Methanococcus voltae]MCS3922903.1 putative proteasome-type protease [Methanococcus voltae PS]
MAEEKILFNAKKGKWYVSKKLKIDENTADVEVSRILISIEETLSKKIKEYLPFDMIQLEEIADEIYVSKKGRVKEEDISQALAKLKSPATTKKLGKLTDLKEGKDILKVILTNIILGRLGISTHVDIKTIDKFIEKSTNK